MSDKEFQPKEFKVTEEDLANTPPAVLELLFALIQEADRLKKRVEELEAKLGALRVWGKLKKCPSCHQ